MSSWSNIEVSPQDPEIAKIDLLETRLGKLPDRVIRIRELITRYEVCHFKSNHHIKIITESIESLEPGVAPDKIGMNHIKRGENAWKNDTSGKSLLGQQYVWALKDWLGEIQSKKNIGNRGFTLERSVQKWLGNKEKDKIRLIRFLLARLTWDWKSFETLQHGGDYEDLEFQISRIDICHYNFPSNLNSLLIGIGAMKPVKDFEGCGSYNVEIQKHTVSELKELNMHLKALSNKNDAEQNNQIKIWLLACFIKTLKEQAGLSEPLINLGE